MRKTIIATAAAAFAVLCTLSCSTESTYSSKGTPISLAVTETTSSYVAVDVVTDKDTYYYCNIITAAEFSSYSNDQRFMELNCDKAYMEYINWRFGLLAESSEFVASFVSHSLNYGNDSRFFTELNPETEYIVYAFCVNALTNQPVGQLYTTRVRTSSRKSVDMSFSILLEQKGDAPYVTVIPSNDTDSYVWEFEDKEVVESQYGHADNNYELFLQNQVHMWKSFDLSIENEITHGFDYYDASTDLESGRSYILVAAPYDGEINGKIYGFEFTYPFGEVTTLHKTE